MSHPARALAFLRIVTGLYFAKTMFTKFAIVFVGGWLPLPGPSARWIATLPVLVGKQAAGNPVEWYRNFLVDTVIPHAHLFAVLTAWGEAVVGILLTLGFLTGIGSLVGLILVVSYGLATQWMSPGQQGFHLLLVSQMLVFFLARAGRRWGVDGVLARTRPKSLLARRPFS